MIHILPTDIETRSTVDLRETGVHVYATHPTTEVLCVGYCCDDGPVKIWRPGEPVPNEFFVAAKDPNWRMVAHNASFERLILEHKLTPLHGFPIIPLERTICTMALAHAAALPGALEKLARHCNFKHQKDVVGERIMLQMIKPRRALKRENKNGVYFYDDAERRHKLEAYCKLDVEATREAADRLPWLSPEEQAIWSLDCHINNRGFYLDEELAKSARKIATAANPIINEELTTITDGKVTAFTQVARLLAWIKTHIPEAVSLGKGDIEELLELDLPDNVRRVLELRYLGAQAAVAKVDALLQRRCSDGRIRGSFVYHAAGTGRWSSRGAQVHNLKRSITEDIERAVKIIGTGDLDLARKEYDNPLSVIGDLIRAMIVAAPGHTLIGADFSGIEARATAWIAGENKKLDVFRAYDEGRGPDPYIVAASIIFGIPTDQVTKEQRQYGKGAELAFGFQGGVKAFQRFLPSGTPSTASESDWKQRHGSDFRASNPSDGFRSLTFTEEIKDKWRRAHPNIVRFWSNVDLAAHKAVHNPGSIISVGNNLQFTCDDSPFMQITLPSGRQLSYPQARKTRAFTFDGKIVEHPMGYRCLLFKDAANGRWRDVKVYGGILTENIVQAIARDLLAEAMLRIDAAGLKIIAHIHDEIVIEVPDRDVEKAKKQFTRLMMQLPDWAEGLPVTAKAWSGQRYVK